MQGGKSNYESQDAWVSDLDPIMDGKYRVAFFEPFFPLEVRRQISNSEVDSVKEMMQLRIMTESTSEAHNEIKIELRSQENLYNVFLSEVDERRFEKIKKNQQLNFGFGSFLPMLTKQLRLCQKEMNQYSCVLFHNKISEHRLEIIENLEYKRIILLSLEFHDLDEELLKNYVIYRFTKIKMNKQIINKKLKDVFSLLKIKNPQILMDIDKKEKMKDHAKTNTKNY